MENILDYIEKIPEYIELSIVLLTTAVSFISLMIARAEHLKKAVEELISEIMIETIEEYDRHEIKRTVYNKSLDKGVSQTMHRRVKETTEKKKEKTDGNDD